LSLPRCPTFFCLRGPKWLSKTGGGAHGALMGGVHLVTFAGESEVRYDEVSERFAAELELMITARAAVLLVWKASTIPCSFP
jgi:hypothetical protein